MLVVFSHETISDKKQHKPNKNCFKIELLDNGTGTEHVLSSN